MLKTASAGLKFSCRNVSQIETDLRDGMHSKDSVNTENRPLCYPVQWSPVLVTILQELKWLLYHLPSVQC